MILLEEDGSTKEDLRLPEGEDDKETSDGIKDYFKSGKDVLVSVLSAMGMEKVVGYRES